MVRGRPPGEELEVYDLEGAVLVAAGLAEPVAEKRGPAKKAKKDTRNNT